MPAHEKRVRRISPGERKKWGEGRNPETERWGMGVERKKICLKAIYAIALYVSIMSPRYRAKLQVQARCTSPYHTEIAQAI